MGTATLAYEISQQQLDNGLLVAVAPDPAAPGVTVNAWVAVGSADEAPHRTGFAHLFEHLMFQGSKNVASGEHMATIEAMGGQVNATTSSDRTNYFETVPRGGLELALWLEADRLNSLAITAENFEAQRGVVKEEKRQRYDNQPYGDVLELVMALHFDPAHPYGHPTIGSMADLDAAKLAEVAEFFTNWYPASNIRLVLCGALNADEGFELAQRYLGHLPQAPKPARQPMPDLATPTEPVITVVREVPHSAHYLSWATPPAGDPARLAVELILAILADGHSSRLHRTLVKGAALARDISAGSLTHFSAPSTALITTRAAEGTQLAGLGSAIRDEVARFIADGPTEEELLRAVAQYEHDWLITLATTASRADAINEAWHIQQDPLAINYRLDEVLRLEPQDLTKVAQQWLAPENAKELRYVAGGLQ